MSSCLPVGVGSVDISSSVCFLVSESFLVAEMENAVVVITKWMATSGNFTVFLTGENNLSD